MYYFLCRMGQNVVANLLEPLSIGQRTCTLENIDTKTKKIFFEINVFQ